MATLESRAARWMSLRSSIASEQRDWEALRAQWEFEAGLLERESGFLASELSMEKEWIASLEDGMAEQKTRRDELRAEMARLTAVLELAEGRLSDWDSRWTSEAPRPASPGFFGGDAPVLLLLHRAVDVVERYSRIEEAHLHLHVGEEIMDTGDEVRRQVKVLRLGLAQAWAVSHKGDWAATGRRVDGVWRWQPDVGQAVVIRQAIDILNRRHAVRWVELPLAFGEEMP